MILYFQPREGIGEVYFGESKEKYFNVLQKSDELTSESEGYEVYELPEKDMAVYFEDGVVDSINCKEECLFKGRNIIGMSYTEFISYYDLEPDGEPDELDFEEDNIPQLVYEFDDLGLQVWTKNDIVVTVIASNIIDE